MGAGVERLERQRVVEVDVGDHRDRRFAHDRLQRLRVLVARDCDADEVSARLRDPLDLRERRLDVGGLGLGHRLHGDGRAAADRDAADVDLVACEDIHGESSAAQSHRRGWAGSVHIRETCAMEAGAELVARARLICGEQHVLTHPTVLSTYRSDGLRRNGPLPLAAILPGSAAEVAGVVSACAATGTRFVVRGAGTSQSGGALPIADGVLIVLTRMRRILALDEGGDEITVEPGTPPAALARAVAGTLVRRPGSDRHRRRSHRRDPRHLQRRAASTSCNRMARRFAWTLATLAMTSPAHSRGPADGRGSPSRSRCERCHAGERDRRPAQLQRGRRRARRRGGTGAPGPRGRRRHEARLGRRHAAAGAASCDHAPGPRRRPRRRRHRDAQRRHATGPRTGDPGAEAG